MDDAATARRKAFVDAARELFFANGYAGTTMSSIASKVGGSKTTLWTYFPSKEDLFEAVVDDIVERYGDALAIDLPLDEPVPDVLRRFGNVLMTKLTATPLLSLFRLVVGEAERFPHLSKTFYDRGPRRGKARAARPQAAGPMTPRLIGRDHGANTAVEAFYGGWRPAAAGWSRHCLKRRQFLGPSLLARAAIMLTRRRGTDSRRHLLRATRPGRAAEGRRERRPVSGAAAARGGDPQ